MNNRWMGELIEQNLGNVKIENLIIPGTHDSGAYKTGHFNGGNILNRLCNVPMIGAVLKAILRPLVITQHLSIKEQLEAGARYLDLRLAYDAEQQSFFLAHTVSCISLEEALQQINSFLSENPNEMLFVALKPDLKNKDTLNEAVTSLFFSEIKKSMAEKLWENLKNELVGKKSLTNLKGKAVVCYSNSDPNYTSLIQWRNENGAFIHPTNDGGGLNGQLDTNWENKPTGNELIEATVQNKMNKKHFPGKVKQLDGAPTPDTKKAVLTILWNITLGWNVGLLLNLFNITHPIGIKKEAQLFASGCEALFSKLDKGHILSIDFFAHSEASKNIITKSITTSISIAKEQKKIASIIKKEDTKENEFKRNEPTLILQESKTPISPFFTKANKTFHTPPATSEPTHKNTP